MRRSLFRLAVGFATLAASTVPMVVTAGSAGAVPPSGTDVIAIAGSDTTQDVMHAMFGCADFGASAGLCPAATSGARANQLAAQTPYTNPVYNLKFPDNVKDPVTVPADPYCVGTTAPFTTGVTYKKSNLGVPTAVNPEVTPPAGSGAGRTALINSVSKTYPSYGDPIDNPNRYNAGDDVANNGGCIDVARSSGFASTANLEFYAFGLDAVGVSSPSLKAPATLTLAQVRAIYHCDVNDWSQVGGGVGKIQRVVPQAGSGTGDFFMQVVLATPTTARPSITNFPETGPSPLYGGTCATPFYVEENNGKPLAESGLYRNEYQNMIVAYSSGKWVYQANNSSNPSVDIRANQRPIAIVNNDATTGIATAPPQVPVRWVGSSWRLNDASVLVGGKYNQRTAAVTNTSIGASTITAAAGTFTQNDVGKSVTQNVVTFLGANTRITAVDGTGAIATVSPAPTADGGTGSVNLFDVNRTADDVVAAAASTQDLTAAPGTFRARDVGLTMQGGCITDGSVIQTVSPDGSAVHISNPTLSAARCTGGYPNTADVSVGWSLISDKNPNVLTISNIQYPGARYVYNVINTQSPDFVNVRNLVGFDNSSGTGLLSAMCLGDQEGVINSNGFLALPALDRDGPTVGNDQLRTCVKRV